MPVLARGLTPNVIDRTMPRRRNDPRGRIRRNACFGPPPCCDREGFLHGVFHDEEIVERSIEGRDDPSVLRSKDALDFRIAGGHAIASLVFRLVEGAHFDRKTRSPSGSRSPVKRNVEILYLDDPEAADVLFAFEIRSIGRQDLAIVNSDDCCGTRVVEPARKDPRTQRFEFFVHMMKLRADVLQHIRWRQRSPSGW